MSDSEIIGIGIANSHGQFFIDREDADLILSHASRFFRNNRGYIQCNSRITKSTQMVHRIVMRFSGKEYGGSFACLQDAENAAAALSLQLRGEYRE